MQTVVIFSYNYVRTITGNRCAISGTEPSSHKAQPRIKLIQDAGSGSIKAPSHLTGGGGNVKKDTG